MGKGSFQDASAQKRIPKGKVWLVILLAVALSAALVLGALLVRSRNAGGSEAPLAAAPAAEIVPTSIKYYDPKSETGAYETGADYILMDNGGGTRLRVGADGTVSLTGASGEDLGTLSGQERQNAIASALRIAGTDAGAMVALTGLEAEKAPAAEAPAPAGDAAAAGYSEASLARLLNDSYGITVGDFYASLQASGTSMSDFYSLVDAGASPAALVRQVLSEESGAKAAAAEEAKPAAMGISIEKPAEQGAASSAAASSSYPDWMQEYSVADTMSAVMNSLGQATAKESGWDAANGQTAKKDWIAEQQGVEASYDGRVTDRDLVEGTVVPITLITGIDTDMPGEVVGMVRQNVYDSLTGRNILIPKGSRLMAAYSSSVTFGQTRVAIAWRKLVTPDGRVYTLPGFQGVTGEGYSGVKDKYSSHFWSLLGGALLGSLIDFSAGVVQDQTEAMASTGDMYASLASVLAQGAAGTVETLGSQYASQMASRQPTIRIRTGTETFLLVNQTISFD